MAGTKSSLGRVAWVSYLILLHAAFIFLLGALLFDRYMIERSSGTLEVAAPGIEPIAPPVIDESTPQPLPSPVFSQTPALLEPSESTTLTIPVTGVTADQLTDTFNDARSEGRTHDAIDIPAAAGTPVIAAADGRIVKFWDSHLGGITIYQLSSDQKHFYYYAHLQKRADGLREGDIVRRGTTIGFVGDTGNAGSGNYHLHFAVSEVIDPKRYWDGRAIDPYPLLKSGTSAR